MQNIISKYEKNEQFSKDYDKLLLKKNLQNFVQEIFATKLGILGIIKNLYKCVGHLRC